MELGDIVTIGTMIPAKSFNKSFSSRHFMITGLTRSSGRLSIEMLDVTKNS
jgi:c-di-AMP phosphodiesterase-like protein